MHDPGEPPLAGGLLWARHGKGTFVYTGLAFFRQLPAGVPGAYRLFANLLAGGQARAWPTEPATASGGAADAPRAEMDDAPPFLSWRAIYLIVLGALAVEIVARRRR